MKGKNFSDWIVALAVVLCSIVLFCSLWFALSGISFAPAGRILKINFVDVTGVTQSATVKYAGAEAGTVIDIRMLSLEERKASGNPANAVQLTLALSNEVPPLPADVTASVAADTLLSDKYILISGGSADASLLADDVVLQGISPVSFDQLARNLDVAIHGITAILSSGGSGQVDIFSRLNALLTDVQKLTEEAKPALADIRAVAKDAQQLLSENKTVISSTLGTFDKAAKSIDQLATRGNVLIRDNEKRINSTLLDIKVSTENLKVTSTYAKILIRSLAQRPSQLIWGSGKPPLMPSERDILRSPRPIE